MGGAKGTVTDGSPSCIDFLARFNVTLNARVQQCDNTEMINGENKFLRECTPLLPSIQWCKHLDHYNHMQAQTIVFTLTTRRKHCFSLVR